MIRPVVRICRGALSGFFFVAYGLFALPFAILLPLPFVPASVGRKGVRIFYRLFVFLARVTGLYRVTVVRGCGSAGTPRPTGGRIVVMNHVSLIDVCVLLAHLGDAVCIVKAAAKRNPFLSAVVRKAFIANDKGGEATVAEVKAFLAKGIDVVVFPQGTRGGEKLQRGAARLALAAQCDIACYHIAYDPVVLAKGQPWWDVGDKIIRIALTEKGSFRAEGPNDHKTAVALTSRIASEIMES